MAPHSYTFYYPESPDAQLFAIVLDDEWHCSIALEKAAERCELSLKEPGLRLIQVRIVWLSLLVWTALINVA